MIDTAAQTQVAIDYSAGERLTMNMGPQHPSAHGVFRAILTLQGETVVGVDAVIGYLHRCHEKLAETLTYAQYPTIASKTDYVAAMTSEFAYVLAAEQIGAVEVPKRAQYIRVIAAELQRVASHLLWLGTWCMDMGGALGGGATVFLYCIRERELILDLFESLVGARLLYGLYQVGGVRYDLPAEWARQCRDTLAIVEQRLLEYERLLEDNPFFLASWRKMSASRVRCCAARASISICGARSPTRRTGISRSPFRSRPTATASRAIACGWSSSVNRSRSCVRHSTGSRKVRSRRVPR
jgi:NADH:ubiquinone oxidoreductase subunit D